MTRKTIGTRKSNILKRSREELETTRVHMQRVEKRYVTSNVIARSSQPTNLYPSEHNNVQCSGSIKDIVSSPYGKRIEGSRPALFKAMASLVQKEANVKRSNHMKNRVSYASGKRIEGSRPAEFKAMGSLVQQEANAQRSNDIKSRVSFASEKRIEGSRPAQFKVMARFVQKEGNVNAVNKYKGRQSRVKEGLKATSEPGNTILLDKGKKLDSATENKEFVPRIFGKDLSNNPNEPKEVNSKLGRKEHVSSSNAKTTGEKRQRESQVDGKIETIAYDPSQRCLQVENKNCRQVNKRRCRKVIFEDDNVEIESSVGDQSLIGINDDNGWIPKTTTLLDYSDKFPTHCCSKPIDEPTWSGIFKIDQKYVPLAGHLSTKYNEKVLKLTRSLFPVVGVTKLPRSKAWPKSWEVSKPNCDDIGLYFFPHEMRKNEGLDELVKEVMENDLVLQAIVGEAEMLIFPSTLLPEKYKTFRAKHYLWGVFKPRELKRDAVAQTLDVVGCCAQEVEKDKQHEEQGQETMLMNNVTTLGNQDLPSKNTYGVQSTGVHVKPSICFEAKALGQERQGDALRHAAGVGANATVGDGRLPGNQHAQADQSRGLLPSGRVFGFVVEQTPRLLQLFQELERDGGVVFAMEGQMIGAGPLLDKETSQALCQ